MRILRTHELGGTLDTIAEPPLLVGPSRAPVTWFCSEDQERVLFYSGPCSQIIYGSEGAGKSQLLAMLHYVWWLELLGEGREAGQTAPTRARLKHVRLAMFQLFPKSWYRYVKNDMLMTFADGHRVQFVSTKIQSEAQGSPLQGYNFSRGAGDELQDQVEVSDDLEARGRSAAEDEDDLDIELVKEAPEAAEFYKQAYTCTASDKPRFRALVARKLASGDWIKHTLLIANSPFISTKFIERKRRVMTDREFRRRFLAEELPPERMLYFCWSREHNLRPIPPKAKRITSIILRAKTGNPAHQMLGGNDPGVAKACTIFLDAYQLPRVAEHVWFARYEVFTMHRTTEQHVQEVLGVARSRFALQVPRRPERLHVRSHPVGLAEHKPGQDVYRTWKRAGVDARSAQYNKKCTGTGVIKLEDRIEMMNRLLCDARGVRRLFVEADKYGNPMCPRLVEAFEGMERDDELRAERDRKDETDLSDPPSACAYGLWPFEKVSAGGV
jgi:hypothetical protein